jgi:hypothetical protein
MPAKIITVMVDGVKIQLTDEQMEIINKAKQAKLAIEQKRKAKHNRQHELDTNKNIEAFRKILLSFGFTTVDTSDWPSKNSIPYAYEHVKNGWYAEIYRDRGGEIWMVGQELKSGSTPDGWIYGEPKEVKDELTRTLNKIKNKKTTE